jgi:hypothetical protein
VPEAADFTEAPPPRRPSGPRPGIADVPTEEHPPPEGPSEEASLPEAEAAPPERQALDEGSGPALYDFETDEALAQPGPAPEPPSDEFEATEAERAELGEEPFDEGSDYDEEELEAEADEELEGDDLLSAPPDFIDEETEGEDLWFEKRPPEDFDFEDER